MENNGKFGDIYSNNTLLNMAPSVITNITYQVICTIF